MNQKANNSIGCSTVVLIVFVILKLVGVIDWSWWWVLSPLWLPIALIILIHLVIYLIAKFI